MRRYLHGWRVWWWTLHKVRTKKHGAGKQPWRYAIKSAACARHIADGQFRGSHPRWLKRAYAKHA